MLKDKYNSIIFIFALLLIGVSFCLFYLLSQYQTVYDFIENYQAMFSLVSFLSIAFVFYLWVFLRLKPYLQKMSWKPIVFGAIILCLILAWQPLFNSSDFHQYILQARIHTHYGENSYTSPPVLFQGDLEFCQSICTGVWHNTTNMYGPLWLYFTLIPSYLANGHFFTNYLLLKIFLVVIFLISGWLIYQILKSAKPQLKNLGLYLFLLSPLIIFEVAADGHNDIMVIFLILLHFFLLVKKKRILSFIILLFCCLIKFVTLPMLVLFLIFYFKTETGNKKLKLAGLILLGATLLFLMYLPIWEGLPTLNGLWQQSGITSLYQLSPLVVIFFALTKFSGISDPMFWAKILSTVAFLVFFMIIAIKLCRSRNLKKDYLDASFWSLLLLILFMSTVNRPWYIVWILPLLIIKGRFYWFIVFSYFGILAKMFSTTFILLILFFIIIAYFWKNSNSFQTFKEKLFAFD